MCFPLLFHVWADSISTSSPALLRVEHSACRDAGNNKSSQFHPLLLWQLVRENNASTPAHLHHSLTPLSSSWFSLLIRSLFVVAESTWLTVKHMMTQPGGSERSLPRRLSRTDKDYILWWLRPEPDVISIPDVLHSVWSFSLWRLIHFCRHYLHSTTSITAEKYCQWHRRKEGSTMIPPPACCWRWTKCRTLTLNMKVHILHVFELDHKSTLASVKERSRLLLNVNEVNNEVFLLLQVTFYFSSIQLTPESLPQLKLWT